MSCVPTEKRKKFEPTVEKGIFVGYNETSKAYMFYIPALRKTFIRRDVKFEEGRALSKSLEREQATMQEEEKQVPRQEAQPTPQITYLTC